MKKTFLACSLASLLFLALTSCKGKEEKAAEATPTATTEIAAPAEAVAPPVAATEVVKSIAVPVFANADVTKFCEEFKTLMTEYAAAKGTGDNAKATELEKKFNDWGNKGAGLGAKLKSDEMKKFNDFIGEAAGQFTAMKTATAK